MLEQASTTRIGQPRSKSLEPAVALSPHSLCRSQYLRSNSAELGFVTLRILLGGAFVFTAEETSLEPLVARACFPLISGSSLIDWRDGPRFGFLEVAGCSSPSDLSPRLLFPRLDLRGSSTSGAKSSSASLTFLIVGLEVLVVPCDCLRPDPSVDDWTGGVPVLSPASDLLVAAFSGIVVPFAVDFLEF